MPDIGTLLYHGFLSSRTVTHVPYYSSLVKLYLMMQIDTVSINDLTILFVLTLYDYINNNIININILIYKLLDIKSHVYK